MKKVGLFGGTFDPIHNGHISIALEAYNQLNLDEVWFVPNNRSPFKLGKSITPASHRIKMIEIATRNYPYFKLVDYETKIDTVSYTINTVEHFHNTYENHEFYFIVGADQVSSLDKWYRIEELKELVKIVAFNRPGFNFEKTDLIYLENELLDISSTNEKITGFNNVDPHVRKYIEENNIYG